MLTHVNSVVFNALCHVGTQVLYFYCDGREDDNPEYELGIVVADDVTYYDINWIVVRSTSGCAGVSYIDTCIRPTHADTLHDVNDNKNDVDVIDQCNIKMQWRKYGGNELVWSSTVIR